jgi:hypothetical protein
MSHLPSQGFFFFFFFFFFFHLIHLANLFLLNASAADRTAMSPGSQTQALGTETDKKSSHYSVLRGKSWTKPAHGWCARNEGTHQLL